MGGGEELVVEVQKIVTWGLPLPGDKGLFNNTHLCQLTINFPGNFARRNLTPEHIVGIYTSLTAFDYRRLRSNTSTSAIAASDLPCNQILLCVRKSRKIG